MEIWKEIEGTDGKYSVSNLGNVKCNGFYANVANGGKRFVKEALIKQSDNGTGYLKASMGRFCQNKTIHRLVAKAFIPNPENKEFVNHKNGIKKDNRVENLEWVTRRENEDHAFATGLKKKVPTSKLSEDDVRFILLNHTVIKRTKMAEMFNVSMATINRIVNRVIWSHIECDTKEIEYIGYKTILNKETGIYYNSILEACKSINKSPSFLSHRLTGRAFNNTPFVYA